MSHETEALTILDSRTRVSLPGPETDVTRRLLDLQRATSLLLLGNLVVSSSRMTQPARGRSHLGEPWRTFWAIYVQTHPNLFAIIWQVRCAVCESEPQNFWSLIVSNDVRVVKFVFQISIKTDSVTWQPRFPNEALVLWPLLNKQYSKILSAGSPLELQPPWSSFLMAPFHYIENYRPTEGIR